MSAQTIRNALGLLQDDSENEQAWKALETDLAGSGAEVGMSSDELAKLLASARRAHEARREFEAVAKLLQFEIKFASGHADEADLLAELARVLDEELLRDESAMDAYRRLLAIRPRDARAEEAIEKSKAKQARWEELVSRYVDEAKSSEGVFKSSLLVSAAEVAYRYGQEAVAGSKEKGAKKRLEALKSEIVSRLREALECDPRNRRAELLLERTLSEAGRFDELATVVEAFAANAASKEEMVTVLCRLARIHLRKQNEWERAASAYARVIDLHPGHPEATSALVDLFTEHQKWDDLATLYEEQLSSGVVRGSEEAGTLFQAAMVHWKMRSRPESAEPHFERLRKLDPAHSGVLNFYREWCTARGETARLATILADAQRVLPDGAAKSEIAVELAKLSEEGANATKAIEQWRALMRQDSKNFQARDALKRLYRQTGAWAQLTELHRGDLERFGADDTDAKLAALREIAVIYRDHLKNDAARATVLAQVTTLDTTDLPALRELGETYEALQRWRDLLLVQAKQAELEKNPTSKAELYRAIARRWLDQFSNVQNAVEAYEKLNYVAPTDIEANEKLRELYTKRRAFRSLYELVERQAAHDLPGNARREKWAEMAKLCAERLDRGADAIRLYKQILEEEPGSVATMDALEKQAEREKDWETVAEVLEARVTASDSEATQLIALQKLGSIYSDRLNDLPKAIRTWRRVLVLSPGQAKATRVVRDGLLALGDLDGLTELYASQGEWDGLADVLTSAAEKAVEDTAKIDLSFRAAAVFADKLHSKERAAKAYERVLSVKPQDERAAAALATYYESEQKWAKVSPLYEVLLGHADSPGAKVEWLEKLADVAARHLHDPAGAFANVRRAYELMPTAPGALERLESAARTAGQWDAFVAALGERAKAEDITAKEARALRARIAHVYGGEVGRIDEAVELFRALLEEDDRDDALLREFDALLKRTDRRDDLRWLYGRRIERANTAQKLDLLAEWAAIEEDVFAAPTEAVAIHQRVLAIVGHHGASLRALARLLKGLGDPAGALSALERDRDHREGAERAAREVEIAKLCAEDLGHHDQALHAAERALALVPGHEPALQVIEGLLKFPATRARSAELLNDIYGQLGNWPRKADMLAVRLATTAAREDRIAIIEELVEVHDKKLSKPDAAFDVLVNAVAEYPTALKLWDQLNELATRTDRLPAFVTAITGAVPPDGPSSLPPAVERDLAERAAVLLEDRLGDADRARVYWERVLLHEPVNEMVFSRLRHMFTTREQWADLEAAYERAILANDDVGRKVELLSEIAVVFEDITSNQEKATICYERILELDPANVRGNSALDALYQAGSRWDKLAALLEKTLERGTEAGATQALRLRLATVYSTHLDAPEAALDHVAAVLDADPASAGALALAESLLGHPSLRSRTAELLERAFGAADDAANLARVISVRLESATDEALRKSLYHRLAELRDVRLGDSAGAFAALEALVALDPDDASVRARLIELGRAGGSSLRAVAALEAAAARASSPEPKAAILVEAAEVADDVLAGDGTAERLYTLALKTVGDDGGSALPICRALERIYAGAGESRKLCAILCEELRFETDPVVLQDLRSRVAELRETAENDLAGAIDAWRARLDADQNDELSQSALARLYERASRYTDLVWVLRLRHATSNDPAFRKSQRLFAATILADKLTNIADAITEYQAVIEEFGPDRATLASLQVLFEIADRWPDLASAIETELGLADDLPSKLSLLTRLAGVRHSKLGDIPGAIDAYRQALVLDPSHAESRAALEGFLGDEASAIEAALILQPLYEADGEMLKLLRTFDIEIAHASSEAKLQPIARAVQIAEHSLGDLRRAFNYAADGVRFSVTDPDLRRWVDLAKRLAEQAQISSALIELLRGVVDQIVAEEELVYVPLLLAELTRKSGSDWIAARGYYERALAVRPSNMDALVALQSLLEEHEQWASVVEVLRRRVEVVDGDAERRELLVRVAKLTEEQLHDSAEALAVYERVLDEDFSPAIIANVDRLYRKHAKWTSLVQLLERQLGAGALADDVRAQLFFELGSVFANELAEMDRALDAYAEALVAVPDHTPTVAALEARIHDKATITRVAEMLERVYIARFDWRKVIAIIEARLAAAEDAVERRELLLRLSKLQEEQEENFSAALSTYAQVLSMDPSDEPTWAELERLARVGGAKAQLAQVFGSEAERLTGLDGVTVRLAERAAELLASEGEHERALALYRRAFAFEPSPNGATFRAIDELLSTLGKAAERIAHYKTALELESEPSARARFLHAKAALEESLPGGRDSAIATWKEAFELDGDDDAAREALTRLFTAAELWRDLADLYRRKAEAASASEEQIRWRLLLAAHLDARIKDAGAAVTEYEAVIAQAANEASSDTNAAVAALEQILSRGEQKARVIEVVLPVYEQRDDFRNIIRICTEQASIAPSPSERISAWKRVAELWETRAGDLRRAFDTLKLAYLQDPSDADTREQLDRLALATSRWDDLVAIFEESVTNADASSQRAIWACLATIHDKRRDDPRRALEAWGALFRLDETDLAPLDEMDALATLLSDWATLAQVLARKAELVVGDDAIATVFRRLGETRRDMLDDVPGALHAYERASELDPADAYTLDCVIELSERSPNPERLVELYKRRVELCSPDETDTQFTLLVAAADQCANGLRDRREAIQLLAQARDLRNADDGVLSRLDHLYTAEEMWSELQEVLRQQASLAEDASVRWGLEKRIGLLLSRRLSEHAEAVVTLRSVVEAKADDEVVAELRSIGEKFDELRAQVAEILEPVLRRGERFEELVDLFELRLRAEAEAVDRARTLLQIAEVENDVLLKPEKSLEALLRALRESSDNPVIHTRIEETAGRVGLAAWSEYADVLGELARGSFDAEGSSDLFRRLGVIAEERLNALPRAAEAYKLAAERIGDTPDLLRSLDRVLLSREDWPALADVLERRIVVEESSALQAELYYRLAAIQLSHFGEKGRGLASLRAALERSPEHGATRASLVDLLTDPDTFAEAFDALESVYRASSENLLLAELYQKRIEKTASAVERVGLWQELVRILEHGVKDLPAAQRAVEATLRDAPAESDTARELERLAGITGDWARATSVLAEVLRDGHALPVTTQVELYQTLSRWRREQTGEPLLAEKAIESALTLEPENLELYRELERMQRSPGRERDLVATLRRIARVESSVEEKRALLHEAATIAHTALTDASLEESCLKSALVEDESDAWAIECLVRLRENAGDPLELVSLLLRLAELTADGLAALELRHRAAAVLVEPLRDLARATTLYEEILDFEPDDRRSIDRLRSLYAEQGRKKDLSNLLRRLIDVSPAVEERAALRFELARLCEELNAPEDAIDLLRAVLDEVPSHTDALLALSRLYESGGRDADMADLLRVRVEAAAETGDVEGEIKLLLRLADLQERRLDDARSALESLDRAAERGPGRREVYEAIARVSINVGDPVRAAEALWRLIELLAGAEAVDCALRIADLSESVSDTDGVERALRRGLATASTDARVRGRLRTLYESQERFQDLAELLVGDADLLAGTNAAPANVVALLRQAADLFLSKLDDRNAALRLFERASQLVPSDRDLLLLLCDTYTTAERYADAASALERVIASFGGKRSKEVSVFYHRLGGLFRQMGDKAAALAQFDHAFKIDPGSVAVLRDLGMLAFETDDLDRAQKTFRALLLQRLDPGSGTTKNEVFYYLGEISLRLGDRSKAQQMFERAIENDPSDSKSRARLLELRG